ncbi:DUF3146 family protein [Synechococcus sp. PCC 6717]|nr:DUF3146 family protein [Synechococcus sp. PCC 6717]
MAALPQTIAHVRITAQNWQEGHLRGQVCASHYEWDFCWLFKAKTLIIGGGDTANSGGFSPLYVLN